MWRRWSVFAITAVLAIAIQIAPAAETPNNPAEAEEVTVTAEGTGSLTSASPDESAKQGAQVPGGFAIKTADEMKMGRRQTSKICCSERPAFFFNPKMVQRCLRFRFEGPESPPKTSHWA